MSKHELKPLVIIGGGGHAAGLAEILLIQKREVVAIVSPELSEGFLVLPKLTYLRNDDDVFSFDKTEVELINGIGSMPKTNLREKIHTRFKKAGYTFSQVIASTAHISPYAYLAEGVQVLNNAVVCIGTFIGESTIINTASSIDHDCEIAKHCHIAPGVVMSGNVKIEERVHIATGASIINNVSIGANSIIGVGASITKSIPTNSIAYAPKVKFKAMDDL